VTQSIVPPPNYRAPGSVATLTAPVVGGGIAENTLMSYVVPLNSAAVGTMFEVSIMGRLTAPATATTLIYRLKMGAVTLATLTTTPGNTTAGLAFSTKAFVVCTVTGVSGRFNGGVISEVQLVAVAQQHIGNVPGANVTNIDTTLNQSLALTYQWSAAPTLYSAELGTINLIRL